MSTFVPRAATRAVLASCALALAACSMSGSVRDFGAAPGPTPGGFGATPGGAQDINHARDAVRSGVVPTADMITVEGLLSQHDIPSDGAPCDSLLCARPSLGVAPSLEGDEQRTWLLLGMSSGLAELRRPPIDLSLVIDASQSMSIDMEETIEAATRLIAQLRDEDRLAVIVFRDDVRVARAMAPLGADRSALVRELRGVTAHGGADVFGGLAEGYEQVRAVGDDAGRLRRVVILSCGYVTGAGASMVEALVAAGGEERIGLTFVGVLLSYDRALADILGRQRGGNHFYTATLPEIEQVFDTDLDFTLTPLAYDLEFEVALASGWEIERLYGIPGDTAGAGRAGFEVSTAFISRRGGAIIAQLRKGEGTGPEVGTVSLSYTPESAHGWSGDHEEHAALSAPTVEGEAEVVWGGDGVRKAVALVRMAERLRAASAAWHSGSRDDARAVTDTLLAHLEAEADALDDEGLRDELTFVRAYRALMD